MPLREQEFVPLARQTAQEEVGAELEVVLRRGFEEFAVEGVAVVQVIGWEGRHLGERCAGEFGVRVL